MPFTIVAAGTSLQIVYTDGTIATGTLPAGVVVSASRRGRFAVIERNVVCVWAPSRPVWIDGEGAIRPLSLTPPGNAPTLAAGSAGSLTGDYKAKVSFLVKDDFGNVLMESELSEASDAVTVSADMIDYSNIPVSLDSVVTGRRIYRTADGPTDTYFHAFDIDDNTSTTFSDDTTDEATSLVPAPTDLGAAPINIELIREWKGRLWGKNPLNVDTLYGSASGKFYAWPSGVQFVVRPIGRDRFGITGMIPRRDELGIGRRDMLWKLTGDSEEDFALVKVVEGKGIYSDDSVAVVRDVGYFLADDGVYAWDSDGVRSISDEKVKPWFTTDTYFNRAQFPNAFARYNPATHAYELFLAAAGGSTINRWVSYSIADGKWTGPHKTDELTPSSAGLIYDSNELLVPAVGSSSGYVYQTTPGTLRDGAATAIALDVVTNFHGAKEPDYTRYWGELSILTKIQAGGTLTITPTVGRLGSSSGAAISHDMTLGRQRLRRLGIGALCRLQFTNSELNQAVELYGYEIPNHVIGRR